MRQIETDYLVIGAGSAGCVLASRLSEDPSTEVIVLEAGGWDWDPLIHVPLGYGKMLADRRNDWGFDTEPVRGLDGRRLPCERGRVVGGSSSTNAMVYVRGHREDYARWASAGLRHWSYAHVLPYFRKAERWSGGADDYRGGDGPLRTCGSGYADPLVEAGLDAAAGAGFPISEDYNGAEQEGFGRLQTTIGDGRRCSTAVAYLRPALQRRNLTLKTRATVTRILVENGRAIGAEALLRGKLHRIRARREVLLCAGAIKTPQLLMLSGVGSADDLRRHGISVALDSPGVGGNLQDHVQAGFEYERATPGPFQKALRLDRIGAAMAKAYFLGKGFATDLPSGWTAFLKTQYASVAPDIQLLFRATPLVADPYLPPFRRAFEDGFACRAVLLRPESRGRIGLHDADPLAPPRIEQSFLDTDKDRATLRAGVRLVRELARQPRFAGHVAREREPGPAVVGDADLDAHIRASAGTVRHPLGTCRMGSDADRMAVLDSQLRVRGIDGLRVVDASAMPDLTGGNINAVVIMIAEAAADFIRGQQPLPAAVITSRAANAPPLAASR
ncbi:GMC family oxidoreductase [Bosea sp. (in: a-proteobacteria)]|uniref:GMC family oxidoreductase n=1 Tax=Bosea sp. (in: a-proteobacteria) TaxID=1871050 RepID=UPI002DDD8233|nr:GMC family oxidoreductase N-terminal domain-containing protein [Bosea sp. (in: a-proteobacteria)]HEV2508419.1 GMC family oxidoreductase N-terminal domain-containing protein [Bosea sp. (in: a-proteobacteria)]